MQTKPGNYPYAADPFFSTLKAHAVENAAGVEVVQFTKLLTATIWIDDGYRKRFEIVLQALMLLNKKRVRKVRGFLE